ncbi:ABC transporter permease [Fibrisoma montanum]|uniref:ABC transporter permease n=1 Tax=Fibrisoma montanum TaxID=2305895 RepID=A0A418M6C9_9BACT|nr:ABC transporter permease [Fibrisoma montanum]RIV21424.1 ABC transporter permease [Fibrisoma montanum]
MNRTLFLIEKEFKQIFRNSVLLRMMIAAPVLQLILLTYAANFEVKNLTIAVVDGDHTTYAQRLTGKFRYIDNFQFLGYLPAYKSAYRELLAGRADLVLVIPPHFERDLGKQNGASLQLLVSAIDGSKAGIATGYAQTIIRNFNDDIRAEIVSIEPGSRPVLNVENQYWYNPRLEYKTFMVPGILFELLILVGGMIAALNIVREKEIGTQEQLNVTPIKKHEFILGKLTPFVLIGLVQFTMGLLVGIFLFRIPAEGSIMLMYGFAFLFLLLCVGLGLLISAISDTQQQAMFAVFFCLVLFILLSGLFSSTENMPQWAQYVNLVNPLRYIIEVGRNVMLKGSSFRDVQTQFFALLIIASSLIGLASWRYRKTV